MSKRWMFFLLSAGVFLLFVFFSYLVHKNLFLQFDFDMTVRLQDHISRRFDTIFSLLSTVGQVEFVSIFLLIVIVIYHKWKGLLFFIPYGIFHLFEIYGKTFVSHLPPPQFMLRTQQIGNFSAFYVRTQNSYPSGHAARALFLTTLIYLLIRKSGKLSQAQKVFIYCFLAIYDMCMITSRIYLGEHWTSDIIGGSLLGISASLLCGIVL